MESTELTHAQVVIGRLRKRIAKLQQQRDAAREENVLYRRILNLHPHLETRFETYAEIQQKRAYVESLERRVREQEKLIEMMMKEETRKGENV